MINTYNETSLHNTLKNLYADTYGGKTEVKIGNYICDVVTTNENIIEIQTSSLAKLLPKLLYLRENHSVRLVYPMPCTRIIELTDKEGTLISRRKSPKKLTWYSLFDELMGIYPILLEKNFSLEVLRVSITEERVRTAEPVQLKNKSRRFRKNWYKTEKKLDQILERKTFSSASDYLSLLPKELPEMFCAKDIALAGAGKNAHKMLWVLKKMELISFSHKTGKTNFYTISKN